MPWNHPEELSVVSLICDVNSENLRTKSHFFLKKSENEDVSFGLSLASVRKNDYHFPFKYVVSFLMLGWSNTVIFHADGISTACRISEFYSAVRIIWKRRIINDQFIQ